MIEKNIFQTWKSKSDIPAAFKYWRGTVKHVNSNFQYYFWDDADNRRFIKKYYPWFLEIYDEYPVNIYRVDAVRYFWLYHFGGVYIDLDSECLRPLDDLCEENTGVVLGRMGHDDSFVHSIPNAVMLSSSREKFWLYVIYLLISSRGARKPPEDLTGPMMLKFAVDAFRGGVPENEVAVGTNKVQAMLPDELQPKPAISPIRILPPNCFYPLDWTNATDQESIRKPVIENGRILPRNEVMDLFPKSYIVTYWAHSWVYPDMDWRGDSFWEPLRGRSTPRA